MIAYCRAIRTASRRWTWARATWGCARTARGAWRCAWGCTRTPGPRWPARCSSAAPRAAPPAGTSAYLPSHSINLKKLRSERSVLLGFLYSINPSFHRYLQQTWLAVNVFAAHRVYCLVIYCVIATIFRHHLYVWTVFSPKMLYDFVAVLFTIQALGTIANIEALTHMTSCLARYASYKRGL